MLYTLKVHFGVYPGKCSICYLIFLHLASLTVMKVEAESKCSREGLVIASNSGSIVSPRSSNPYNGKLCIWRIYPSGAKGVYYSFSKLNLHGSTNRDGSCTDDMLTVYDPFSQRTHIYCGDTDVDLNTPIYIQSNGLDIIFRKGKGSNRRHGFTLDFRAVTCPALKIPRGTNVEVDKDRVKISCPAGHQMYFTCKDNAWYPNPGAGTNVCLESANKSNGGKGFGHSKSMASDENTLVLGDVIIFKLCLIGLFTLIAMGTTIGTAIYLGKRWSRRPGEDTSSADSSPYNSVRKRNSLTSSKRQSSTQSYKLTDLDMYDTSCDPEESEFEINHLPVPQVAHINGSDRETAFSIPIGTPKTKHKPAPMNLYTLNGTYKGTESFRLKQIRDPRDFDLYETQPEEMYGVNYRAAAPRSPQMYNNFSGRRRPVLDADQPYEREALFDNV